MDDADEVYIRDDLAEYGLLYGFIPDGEQLTVADIDAVIKRHKRDGGVWDPERSATPDSRLPVGELFRAPFAVAYISYIHLHEPGQGNSRGDTIADIAIEHDDVGLSPWATRMIGIDFYGDKTQYENTMHLDFEAATSATVHKDVMPSYMIVSVSVYGVGTRFCVIASCVSASASQRVVGPQHPQVVQFVYERPYLTDHSTPGYSWCLGLQAVTGDYEEWIMLPVLSSTFIRQSVLEDSGDKYEWSALPTIEASDGEKWVMLADTTLEDWKVVTEVVPYIMDKYLERVTDEPRNLLLREYILGFEPIDTFMGYM